MKNLLMFAMLIIMSSGVSAQNLEIQMRGFFSYSNNQAYRWLGTLAHPTNVFGSGSCEVSGNDVIITINSSNFISSNKYTLKIKLHKNGAIFDSIEPVSDTDWAKPFLASNVAKRLIISFWRNYSSETISKIENTFGDLDNISTEQMCLAVLTVLYWKYPSGASSASTRSVNPSSSPLSLNLSGRIGNALESTCSLKYNQQSDTGDFSYDLRGNTVKRKLKMVSYDIATNILVLKEYTTKGEVVGSFSGKYKNGSYEGQFTNMEKGVTIPFSMK